MTHIKDTLYDLRETNEITLFWNPAHCEIEGDEQADEAAKDALEEPVTPNMEMIPSDLISKASRRSRKVWQEEWDLSTRHEETSVDVTRSLYHEPEWGTPMSGWIVSSGLALLQAGHRTGLICTTVYL
jgi:hypothetical protein